MQSMNLIFNGSKTRTKAKTQRYNAQQGNKNLNIASTKKKETFRFQGTPYARQAESTIVCNFFSQKDPKKNLSLRLYFIPLC